MLLPVFKERETRIVGNLHGVLLPTRPHPCMERGRQAMGVTEELAGAQQLWGFGLAGVTAAVVGFVKQFRRHCRGAECFNRWATTASPPSSRGPAQCPCNSYTTCQVLFCDNSIQPSASAEPQKERWVFLMLQNPIHPKRLCCNDLPWLSSRWGIRKLWAPHWISQNLLGAVILWACFGQKTAFIQEFLRELHSLRVELFLEGKLQEALRVTRFLGYEGSQHSRVSHWSYYPRLTVPSATVFTVSASEGILKFIYLTEIWKEISALKSLNISWRNTFPTKNLNLRVA